MKLLGYVKPYIDDKGLYKDLDLAVIRLVSRTSGSIINKNNLHLSKSKNVKYRQRWGKYYYVQKNWMFVNVDKVGIKSLWYDLKFKFSKDAEIYRLVMLDMLKDVLESHGLGLTVHVIGSSVSVDVSWDYEGVSKDYKKLSLGIDGIGSEKMVEKLYM